eukprot:Partr_v1_DN27252_c1_g3_i4_m38925 putative NA
MTASTSSHILPQFKPPVETCATFSTMMKRKRTPTVSTTEPVSSESKSRSKEPSESADGIPPPGGVVDKYLKDLQEIVKMQARIKRIECYKTGDIWIKPPLSPLGIAANKLKLKPTPFYIPDVCVWIPDMMHESVKVRCHQCEVSKYVTHAGWPNDPVARRIIGESRSYYVLSCQYSCSSCNIRFLGHMPEVVKLLPPWVQSLFPAYLTHRSGLDKKLVRLMMSAFDEGFGPGPLAEYIRECHYEEYDFRRVRYYDFLVEMPSFREHAERFTEFDNQRGYCGHVSCSLYLSQAYQTIIAEMDDIMDEEMVKRDGRILLGTIRIRFLDC